MFTENKISFEHQDVLKLRSHSTSNRKIVIYVLIWIKDWPCCLVVDCRACQLRGAAGHHSPGLQNGTNVVFASKEIFTSTWFFSFGVSWTKFLQTMIKLFYCQYQTSTSEICKMQNPSESICWFFFVKRRCEKCFDVY